MIKEQSKTKPELTEEISVLKQRIQELEKSDADRKLAEDALWESEKSYRSLFENMLNGFAYCQMHFDDNDRPWDFTYLCVNGAFEILTGLRNVVGKKATEVIPGIREADPELLEIYGRVSKTGKPERLEIFVDSLQMWFWISVYSPERGYFVAMFDVITEKKRAEQKLQESEKKYRELVENANSIILRMDAIGMVTFFNEYASQFLGFSQDEIIGRNVVGTIVPSTDSAGKDLAEMILDIGVHPERYTSNENENMCKDGTRVWVAWTNKPILDDHGRCVEILCIGNDITERKRAEEVLLHSEERFSKAFNMSPYPTVISTLDTGLFIDANDSFLHLLGYTREEVVGRTATELSMWTSWDDRKSLAKKIIEQGFLREELVHLLTKMGDIRDLLLSSEVVTLNREKFILSIFYDITDQKKLEAQLRQAQKMEAIGTLASGIAHDFNNILSAVLGYTEMALGEPKLDSHLRHYLDQVFKAGERARDLVKQILSFSRQSDEKPRPLRVSPIIKEVLKLLRASLPMTIKIRQDIQSEQDTALADPAQIHQILMNLCTNAAHAMRETKGELKVSLAPVNVEPLDNLVIHHNLSPGKYLRLTVGDTGVGIDKEGLLGLLCIN